MSVGLQSASKGKAKIVRNAVILFCRISFIVMDYCPKGNLTQYMDRSPVDQVKIGREILCGLNDLHKSGKVHRDLKPENVLIKEDGTAVLTDFGISGDRNKRMTERNILGRPQQIFGTYAYMPPEQVNRLRGDATVLPTTCHISFSHFSVTVSLIHLYRLIFSLFRSDTCLFSLSLKYHNSVTTLSQVTWYENK